jgi:hypothetical protein
MRCDRTAARAADDLIDKNMQNAAYPYRNPSPQGLGRVLFQRRGALFHALLACLVYVPVGVLILVGLVLIVRKQAVGNLRDLGVIALGAVFCLGMGLMAYFSLRQYNLLRVHEGGVSRRAWGRTRSLLFEEIDRFWFGGGHVYARGAYLGPSYSLAFYPAPGSARRPLFIELPAFRFTARQPYSDQELERFRDWMYQVLSERMRKLLLDGQPVEWTRRLRFLPEGLEYQPNGRSGEDKQVYPYTSISRIEMDWHRGHLKLFIGAATEPQAVEKMVRQPNDVPGLMLLAGMRAGGMSSTPGHGY